MLKVIQIPHFSLRLCCKGIGEDPCIRSTHLTDYRSTIPKRSRTDWKQEIDCLDSCSYSRTCPSSAKPSPSDCTRLSPSSWSEYIKATEITNQHRCSYRRYFYPEAAQAARTRGKYHHRYSRQIVGFGIWYAPTFRKSQTARFYSLGRSW